MVSLIYVSWYILPCPSCCSGKYFTSMHMYLALTSNIADFHGGQVWCWCFDISWTIYKISYCGDSFPVSLCFLRSAITYWSHVGCIYALWFFLVEDELYCFCSWMFHHTRDKSPSLLHIEFFHTSASILLGLFPLNFTSGFAVYLIHYLLHCDCIFLGVYVRKVVSYFMCCYFSSASISNILGAVLNVVTWLTLLVLDLVLYLCGPFISILLSLFYDFSLLLSYGVVLLVCPLFSSILIFCNSHFLV